MLTAQVFFSLLKKANHKLLVRQHNIELAFTETLW